MKNIKVIDVVWIKRFMVSDWISFWIWFEMCVWLKNGGNLWLWVVDLIKLREEMLIKIF